MTAEDAQPRRGGSSREAQHVGPCSTRLLGPAPPTPRQHHHHHHQHHQHHHRPTVRPQSLHADGRCVLLHVGAFTLVFAVAAHGPQPCVIIKVQPRWLLQHQRLLTNLRREIAILHRLASERLPGVVKLLRLHEDVDNVYLAFEPCANGTLFDLLRRCPLTEATLGSKVVAPLLRVLSRIHGLGVVHRDIKPENIFFDAAGGLVLGDFGLALDLNQERAVSRVGTADYMAPEVACRPHPQLLEAAGSRRPLQPPYTEAVDIWAVGVLVLECLLQAHVAPVGADGAYDVTQVMRRVAELQLRNFSQACQRFVAAALDLDPAKRPTAEQLLTHPWLLTAGDWRPTDTAARWTLPASGRAGGLCGAAAAAAAAPPPPASGTADAPGASPCAAHARGPCPSTAGTAVRCDPAGAGPAPDAGGGGGGGGGGGRRLVGRHRGHAVAAGPAARLYHKLMRPLEQAGDLPPKTSPLFRAAAAHWPASVCGACDAPVRRRPA